MDVALRPALPADRFMIRRWLAEPEIAAWWGGRDSAEATIAVAVDNALALARIILCDGAPVGYAHALDGMLAGLPEREGVPAGSSVIDLFVASVAHRGLGIGRRALELLSAEVFETTMAIACVITAAIRNEGAVRAYEKAGYRWVSIRRDPVLGPCWVMVRERVGRQARSSHA